LEDIVGGRDGGMAGLTDRTIRVIGGGLAGAEAAYQIARIGGEHVILHEMRPTVQTPAHKTGYLSELVCSNSFKSQEITNAHGLLKEELRRLDSLIIRSADQTAIPGGKALVVDRNNFARTATDTLLGTEGFELTIEEVTDLPSQGIVIVATGPLTAPALSGRIGNLTGERNLHFFDAVSPILDGSSVDMEYAFFGARYDPDSDDYLNCPLTREEYDLFYDALVSAKRVDLREFEQTPYFEGCLPVEVMAERGRNTLAFGPMKPVGLHDPRRNTQPYAVIQLRREDTSGSLYNMVGFQTKLTYPEQERVFRLVPALRSAVFFRHGSIHRNTFINSPSVLNGFQLKTDERIFFAGQITGVEGYVESTAMGLLAGVAALCYQKGIEFPPPEPTTCIGALYRYISTERKHFQPMNVNFGLLEGYDKRRKEQVARRALAAIDGWKEQIESLLRRSEREDFGDRP
jgi:methylenetetrahydrofolate--tRNA-(uracil-5-)-methyltransferase